jgi:hypothetical protein
MAYRRYHRFNKNNPVGLGKPPFATFNPHSKESPVMRNNNMVIVSIDPGIVNCGIYINCIDTETGNETSIYMARLEFNREENHYASSLRVLNDLEDSEKYFSSAHYIIIESQMAISYDNTRMAQHLITYFMTKLKDQGNRPLIIEFNSQSKTRLLDCPKGMKKPQYKKWCREKAISLLEERKSKKEEKFITCLKVVKKGDDMGDAVCQMYAWMKVMNGESVFVPKPIVRDSSIQPAPMIEIED